MCNVDKVSGSKGRVHTGVCCRRLGAADGGYKDALRELKCDVDKAHSHQRIAADRGHADALCESISAKCGMNIARTDMDGLTHRRTLLPGRERRGERTRFAEIHPNRSRLARY